MRLCIGGEGCSCGDNDARMGEGDEDGEDEGDGGVNEALGDAAGGESVDVYSCRPFPATPSPCSLSSSTVTEKPGASPDGASWMP